MKTLFNLRNSLLLVVALLVLSCATGRISNTGTASDRTGTNGATNGTGKVAR